MKSEVISSGGNRRDSYRLRQISKHLVKILGLLMFMPVTVPFGQVFAYQSVQLKPSFEIRLVSLRGIQLIDPRLSIDLQKNNQINFVFNSSFEATESPRLLIIVYGSKGGCRVEGETTPVEFLAQGMVLCATRILSGYVFSQRVSSNQDILVTSEHTAFQSTYDADLQKLVSTVLLYLAAMSNISSYYNSVKVVFGEMSFAGEVVGCVYDSWNYRSLPFLVQACGNPLNLTTNLRLSSDCILRHLQVDDLDIHDTSLLEVSIQTRTQSALRSNFLAVWEVQDWTLTQPWRWIIPGIISILLTAVFGLLWRWIKKVSNLQIRIDKLSYIASLKAVGMRGSDVNYSVDSQFNLFHNP